MGHTAPNESQTTVFKRLVSLSPIFSCANKHCDLYYLLCYYKDHTKTREMGQIAKVFDRRLKSWKQGDLQELLAEGRTLQQQRKSLINRYKKKVGIKM